MKKVFPIAVVLILIAPTAHAELFRLNDNVRIKLFKKLIDLNDFYANVPSAVNCRRPKLGTESLICKNGDLQLMEIFNSREEAYDIENAAKRPLDHLKFVGSLPRRCSDDACVADFFKKKAKEELGEDTPY